MKLKLTTDQRNRLIYIGSGTLVVLAVLGFLLIKPQLDHKAKYREELADAKKAVTDATRLKQAGPERQRELEAKTAKLEGIESKLVPSAKLSQWALRTVSDFSVAYGVSITQFSTPTPGEVGSLPSFPYTAATYKVTCQALYHNFGRFAADFENQFPYFRFQKLDIKKTTIEPGRPAGSAGDDEKLEFKLELVALVAK